MAINLSPKCWRNRKDCEPIHCIDAEPPGVTEEQYSSFDYEPLSFVCSGSVSKPNIPQDKYRLCFKNHCTDEMSDNDLQDLSTLVTVIGSALLVDSVRKVNRGIVELPAAQATFED